MDAIINTLGAMYIGAMITMCLYGITTLQTYFYFVHYTKDGRGFKVLVSVIWILDTLHVAFVGHAMYHYLVSSFGNPAQFLDGIWSLYSSMAINLIMAVIVQCFFTKRIFKLCRDNIKWWISSVILFFVVAHFCFGTETVVEFFLKKRLDRLQEVTWIAVLPFGITAVLSDIMIAIALCILLAKSRTDYQDTNLLINHLMVFAINRCLLTSAVAIAEVIVFSANPNSFYTLAIDFVIGKLYANSLLATLNSRQSLRGKGVDGDITTGETTTGFRFATPQGQSIERGNTFDLVRVGVTTSSVDGGAGISDEESKDGRMLSKKPRRPLFDAIETV